MLDRDKLKVYFETGKKPTERQCAELIKGCLNIKDDDITPDGNGNIGIGTNVPQSKLHIENSIPSDTGLTLTGQANIGNTDILVNAGGGKVKWANPTHVTNGLWKKIGTTDNVQNDNNANIRIGDSPTNDLSVYSKLDVTGVYENVSGAKGILRIQGQNDWNGPNLLFGCNKNGNDWSNWMQSHNGPLHINSLHSDTILNLNQGNVGIGISDPQNKLHIDNSTGSDTGIRLTNNAGTNRVLVSDNVGNASWKALTAEGLAGTSLTPIGVIVMWSGDVTPTAIPGGWKLCDGNGGVAINGLMIPDLSGRFIVGYKPGNSDYNMNIYGPPIEDTDHYTLNNHGEKITLKEPSMPEHRHYINKNNVGTTENGEHNHSLSDIAETNGLGGQHGFAATKYVKRSTFRTDDDGDHTHGVEGFTNYTVGNKSHENRPPYYVLAFIIKI